MAMLARKKRVLRKILKISKMALIAILNFLDVREQWDEIALGIGIVQRRDPGVTSNNETQLVVSLLIRRKEKTFQ